MRPGTEHKTPRYQLQDRKYSFIYCWWCVASGSVSVAREAAVMGTHQQARAASQLLSHSPTWWTGTSGPVVPVCVCVCRNVHFSVAGGGCWSHQDADPWSDQYPPDCHCHSATRILPMHPLTCWSLTPGSSLSPSSWSWRLLSTRGWRWCSPRSWSGQSLCRGVSACWLGWAPIKGDPKIL